MGDKNAKTDGKELVSVTEKEVKKDENVIGMENAKVLQEQFIKDEQIKIKEIKDEVIKNEEQSEVKDDKVEKKEELNRVSSEHKDCKSLLKENNPPKFVKKNVSFAEKVTPVTLKVQIDECEDDGNDTDLIIDEDDDDLKTKDVVLSQVNVNVNDDDDDDDDDIPLSQIKHGERMVKYRENKKDNESESDEFDTSLQEGREVSACLEVIAQSRFQ